jgi:hypothetical protein
MQPISFTLSVDDFGVSYVGKEHSNHVVGVLEQHSKVTKDCQGERRLKLLQNKSTPIHARILKGDIG